MKRATAKQQRRQSPQMLNKKNKFDKQCQRRLTLPYDKRRDSKEQNDGKQL